MIISIHELLIQNFIYYGTKKRKRVKSGNKDAFSDYEEVLRFIKENSDCNKRQILYLIQEYFDLTEQDIQRYEKADLIIISDDIIVITPKSEEILFILSEYL